MHSSGQTGPCVKKWYVYIVKCNDSSLYTGITTDLQKRVLAHNSKTGGARYTRARRPVRLWYVSEWPDRASAAREEWRIKQLSRGEKLAMRHASESP